MRFLKKKIGFLFLLTFPLMFLGQESKQFKVLAKDLSKGKYYLKTEDLNNFRKSLIITPQNEDNANILEEITIGDTITLREYDFDFKISGSSPYPMVLGPFQNYKNGDANDAITHIYWVRNLRD